MFCLKYMAAMFCNSISLPQPPPQSTDSLTVLPGAWRAPLPQRPFLALLPNAPSSPLSSSGLLKKAGPFSSPGRLEDEEACLWKGGCVWIGARGPAPWHTGPWEGVQLWRACAGGAEQASSRLAHMSACATKTPLHIYHDKQDYRRQLIWHALSKSSTDPRPLPSVCGRCHAPIQ